MAEEMRTCQRREMLTRWVGRAATFSPSDRCIGVS